MLSLNRPCRAEPSALRAEGERRPWGKEERGGKTAGNGGTAVEIGDYLHPHRSERGGMPREAHGHGMERGAWYGPEGAEGGALGEPVRQGAP